MKNGLGPKFFAAYGLRYIPDQRLFKTNSIMSALDDACMKVK
jgi:hypothetical protein